ncbi:MAG TPA: hypothetical protein VFM97_02765 [Gammaproteobacteria bacterium]|nr:hypothetical protein [Gammaproteobacteria bacterium]
MAPRSGSKPRYKEGFDKFVWNKFEQRLAAGPEGAAGRTARRNPLGDAIKKARLYAGFF